VTVLPCPQHASIVCVCDTSFIIKVIDQGPPGFSFAFQLRRCPKGDAEFGKTNHGDTAQHLGRAFATAAAADNTNFGTKVYLCACEGGHPCFTYTCTQSLRYNIFVHVYAYMYTSSVHTHIYIYTYTCKQLLMM